MKGTVKVKEAHAGPLKTVVMIWGGEFEVFYIRFFHVLFFVVFFVSPKSTFDFLQMILSFSSKVHSFSKRLVR